MSAGYTISAKGLNELAAALPEGWESRVISILSAKPPAKAIIEDEFAEDGEEKERATVLIDKSPEPDEYIVSCECREDHCSHGVVLWRYLLENKPKAQPKKSASPAPRAKESEVQQAATERPVPQTTPIVEDPIDRDNPNLKAWHEMNRPPSSALKRIGGGRLKGMTDINPQWRYKALTAQFGMCGFGWKYTVDDKWIVQGHGDEQVAFADISLYVKVGDEWSDPIPGHGGSKFVAKEASGPYNNDEAFKMAITDALSTALKMIGVAADIYMGLWDGSKYAITD